MRDICVKVARAVPIGVQPRKPHVMKAIILSAGQGRRLLPLTQSTPKAALAVAGRSVLEWQLHEIARCAVDEDRSRVMTERPS